MLADPKPICSELISGIRDRTPKLTSMALQVKDLLSSAFGGGLDNLQELQLSRKGSEDVLALVSAPNVANLNISVSMWCLQAKLNLLYKEQMVSCLQFNKLVSLNGLETVMK
ncbi:hypothetical protein ABBQ32_004550 [Trebouxia sp. C0010 RCD-2024]